MRLRLLMLFSLALLSTVSATRNASAAESYDSCTAHYVDTLPATLSAPGTWCLRKDLSTTIASGAAITVQADNVVLDCNGFKLGGLAAGSSSQTFGVNIEGRANATIRNCNIRGFYVGIAAGHGGGGHLIEDNRLDDNLFKGISLATTDDQILRNVVIDTGGAARNDAAGIDAHADMIDNTVSGVYATATDTYPQGIIVQGAGHEVRGNRVLNLAVNGTGYAIGIELYGSGNTIRDNALVAGAAATFGVGIHHSGTADSFCGGNTIANFTTAMLNCLAAGGNASH